MPVDAAVGFTAEKTLRMSAWIDASVGAGARGAPEERRAGVVDGVRRDWSPPSSLVRARNLISAPCQVVLIDFFQF
jgi:hypothetical protein